MISKQSEVEQALEVHNKSLKILPKSIINPHIFEIYNNYFDEELLRDLKLLKPHAYFDSRQIYPRSNLIPGLQMVNK